MELSTREHVLELLKQDKGQWLSGQALCGRLGISRSAVWKQICALKESGYTIDSSTRKGYRLLSEPDVLLPDAIRSGLKTRFLGRGRIHYRSEVDSTNNLAKELAGRGANEGTLAVAEKQLKGRGRRNRSWYSPEGDGLYFSMILRPALHPTEAHKLTIIAAVALAEAVNKTTELNAGIKWPNDLLIEGRKIAGILTEINADPDHIDYAVLGIGLNVLTSDFPETLTSTSTSIYMETGKRISKVVLLQKILTEFEKLYVDGLGEGFKNIINQYRNMSIVLGRQISVDYAGSNFSGIAEAIDDDGRLVIRSEKNRRTTIISGDIIPADQGENLHV